MQFEINHRIYYIITIYYKFDIEKLRINRQIMAGR